MSRWRTLCDLSITGALVALLAAASGACTKGKDKSEPPPDLAEHPPITEAWTDAFERESLGDDYYATGEGYQLAKGALNARGAHNHPLWLRRKLPRDVIVEFDAWSNSSAGDIKVEIFGDGYSHATSRGAYTATGYVLIFGGWGNSKSILARQNEHGEKMAVDETGRKVTPGKRYHWKIVRTGSKIEWLLDGQPFLTYDDASPLAGDGQEFFGFNNWESDLWFDNLKITPARGGG